MTNSLALLLVLSIGLFAGCKRQKIRQKSLPSLENETLAYYQTDRLPDSLNVAVGFSYLTTRSKISIRSPKQSFDNATVSFRVKKDSAIWMSANVLGLEVMRGILAHDGVRMLDRMNKAYTEVSYRTLAQKLGFPLDYPMIQSFFLADIPLYDGQSFEIRDDSQQVLVKQADRYVMLYNSIDKRLKKTTRMEAIDLVTSNKAQAEYSNMQPAEKGLLPYNVQLNLTGRVAMEQSAVEQLFISVNHSSVTVTDSALTFPFQVPNNYKKAF